MNHLNNPKLKEYSQDLRKNMTKEEKHLWYDFLKNLPITFNRQKVVGKYILDFYCAKAKIAVELDGSQHFDEDGIKKDVQRDAFLKENGITVLRYSNLQIQCEFKAVCEDIWNHIKSVYPD